MATENLVLGVSHPSCTTEKPGIDDDSWLYGADSENDQRVNIPQSQSEAAQVVSVAEDHSTNLATDFEAAKEENLSDSAAASQKEIESGQIEDDDSDEDDIQVTIGDIKTGVNNLQQQQQRFGAAAALGARPRPVVTVKASSTKALDINAEGDINGVGTFDYDIDSMTLEERPWRKPGADITDYFNYGFTEETWKKYQERQLILRAQGLPYHSNNFHPHQYASQQQRQINSLAQGYDTGTAPEEEPQATYKPVGANVNILQQKPQQVPSTVIVRPQQPAPMNVIIRTPVGTSSNVTVMKQTTPVSSSAPTAVAMVPAHQQSPIQAQPVSVQQSAYQVPVPQFQVPPQQTPVPFMPPPQRAPSAHVMIQPPVRVMAPAAIAPQTAPPHMNVPAAQRVPPPHIRGPPPGFRGPPPSRFVAPPPNYPFNAPPRAGFGPGFVPRPGGSLGMRGSRPDLMDHISGPPPDWSPPRSNRTDEADSPPRHPASPEHPPGETPLRVSRSRSRERDRGREFKLERGGKDDRERDRRYREERRDRDRDRGTTSDDRYSSRKRRYRDDEDDYDYRSSRSDRDKDRDHKDRDRDKDRERERPKKSKRSRRDYEDDDESEKKSSRRDHEDEYKSSRREYEEESRSSRRDYKDESRSSRYGDDSRSSRRNYEDESRSGRRERDYDDESRSSRREKDYQVESRSSRREKDYEDEGKSYSRKEDDESRSSRRDHDDEGKSPSGPEYGGTDRDEGRRRDDDETVPSRRDHGRETVTPEL